MLGWNEEIKKHLGGCGENVKIAHNVMFTQPQNVFLGDNVRIDPFSLITCKLRTGNNVHITAYSMLGGKDQWVTMGDWTFIGYGSKLFTASEDYSGKYGPVNEYWGNGRTFKYDITLNNFSGIASDVMLFPGVELPEGCCIGAKSLVHTKSELDEYKVYVGNPLRHFKDRDKEAVLRYANDPNFTKK